MRSPHDMLTVRTRCQKTTPFAWWGSAFRFKYIFFLLGCAQLASPAAAQPVAFDTVVVCAPQLLPGLVPWFEHRQRQGHQLALVAGTESLREIKATVLAAADRGQLKTVVLIGDVSDGDRITPYQVPTRRVDSSVIRRWGAEPTFASDNWFGDLDEDGVPELSVGRIPADNVEELSIIVTKILKYEANRDAGLWRRRVNFVAGVGGFGFLTDSVLETAAKSFITSGIPAGFCTTMTQASWRSPFSPDPRLFQQQTIERMNEGCLAWVYLGHGQRNSLDYYRVPGGTLPILTTEEIDRIRAREGAPFAVFLACYTAAFDADPDCMAEELLAAPGGPVAVLGGSCVTMPYAMTVLGNGLLDGLFDRRLGTLGEVLLHAKQSLAEQPDAQQPTTVDRLANLLSPNPELLAAERMEHIALFNLIGDPLLRIQHPRPVELQLTESAMAGELLEIRGRCDVDGRCLVELVCRRDRLTFKPPARPQFEPTHEWLDEMQRVYGLANDQTWAVTEQSVSQGAFFAKLRIPPEATGPAHVRVFVRSQAGFAMGQGDVYLERPVAQVVEAGRNDEVSTTIGDSSTANLPQPLQRSTEKD